MSDVISNIKYYEEEVEKLNGELKKIDSEREYCMSNYKRQIENLNFKYYCTRQIVEYIKTKKYSLDDPKVKQIEDILVHGKAIESKINKRIYNHNLMFLRGFFAMIHIQETLI